jgi:nuclear pore complex protein Nup107
MSASVGAVHRSKMLPASSSGLLIDLSTDEDADEESLQEILQPLQETAERVSKQVEEFARSLHRFQSQHDSPTEDSWVDARRLLEQFNSITEQRLSETQTSLSKSSSSQDIDSQLQLDKLRLECDLWLLASNLLLSRAPSAIESAANNQVDRLQDLHRYASNLDLWNAFLDCDTVAQEYETILVWLQERVYGDDLDLKSKTADLLDLSNRGEMESSVPVYTSLAIKNKKRLLSQAGPLAKDSSNLSSQLDPDAPARQNGRLDPQDEYYEKASWRMCWHMLRGGRSLKEMKIKWSDAKEPYRAILCNISDTQSESAFDSPFLRMMNLATNSQWLRLCKQIAGDPNVTDPVQRASFGLLCGDSSVSNLACQDVDDMVFSLVNSLLIERYLDFVSAYRKRLEDATKSVFKPRAGDHKLVESLFQSLQSDPDFRPEMQAPLKHIETSLISRDLVDFFCELGQAASQFAQSTGRFRHLIEHDDTPLVNESARIASSDADSVRVVAHLQLALQTIGVIPGPNVAETDMNNPIFTCLENNIAAYIGLLQQDQKWSLIPLYASRLSPKRCSGVLGNTMIDITQDEERDRLVRIMRKCNVNVSDTLFAIAVAATRVVLEQMPKGSIHVSAELITTKPSKGQMKIRAGFMHDEISELEDRAILGVEWYRWIDADSWGKACYSVAALYKFWLLQGRFGALRTLAERARLADISLAALSMNLNFGSDQEDEEANNDDDQRMDENDEPSGVMSPRKRQERRISHPLALEGNSRELLYHKSSVWLQLEQLVNALQALEAWQALADAVDT